MPNREFYVVISKNKDGSFVGEVPQLRNCCGRGKTLDELMGNIRKAIEFCLEDDDLNDDCGFVGFYKLKSENNTHRGNNKMKNREFYVVIEKGEDGSLVGTVPGLKGAHSYGRDFDELMSNMREVIALCLEEINDEEWDTFVGIQKIEV